MDDAYQGEPLVSVLLCVKNGGDELSLAISSVLEQTWTALELIVVNDASTDNTRAVLDATLQRDRRVKVIENGVSQGLTSSLNRALSVASGIYIARIDHDDLWLPQKLAKQVLHLESNSEICLLGTDYLNLSQDGKHLTKPISPSVHLDQEIKAALYKFNPFMHSSVLIRAEAIKMARGYDESYKFAQDYALWTSLLKMGRAAILPEVLCYRRVSPHSISYAKERSQRFCALRAKIGWCQHNGLTAAALTAIVRDMLAITTPAGIKATVRRILHSR